MDTPVASNALPGFSAPGKPATARAANVRSVQHLVRSLWRGRYLILACGLLAGTVAYAATKQLPKRYTADGLVAIETQRLVVPELQGVVGAETLNDPTPQVRSEVLMLRSPALLRAVADDLNLIEVEEFNPQLRPPSFSQRLRSAPLEAFRAIFAMLPAPAAAWLESHGIAPPPSAQQPPPTPHAIREAVVEALQSNLAVFNDNRSLVISVAFTSEDPNRAAEFVNRLVARYLEEKQEARATANRGGANALQARLAEAQAELEAVERQVQEVRERHRLIAVRAGSVGQQRLEEITSALARAGEERARIEANFQRATVLARSGAIPVTDLADVQMSQNVGRLRDRESEAVRRVAEMGNRVGPNHPSYRTVVAELAALRTEIATEARRVVAGLGAQAQAAREREAELTRQFEQVREDATRISGLQAELAQLERTADALRSVYLNLLQRVAQTTVEPNSPSLVGTRLVSPAIPPPKPSAPRPGLAAGIGMLGGFCAGALITLMRGPRRDAFADVDELEHDTRLPALAAVPHVAAGWGGHDTLLGRIAAAPRGPEAEELRGLRTRLRFIAPNASPRSLLFAASVPGEGASTLAAAFARVAAADGLRVLLIEGDLHTPCLARILGIPGGGGLIAALNSGTTWREAVTWDARSSLHMLLAGGTVPEAHQLLESVRFQHLLAEATEEYNLVVLDSRPVARSAEAMILAHRVEATVLVVQAGQTPREHVRSAAERLVAASLGVTVAVLNRANARRKYRTKG